jgi:hypothetical protein
MKFYVNVLLCAFVILVIILLVVYFQLKDSQNKLYPASLTSCPDNWAINPETGNCIIPNRDVSGANLGTLINSAALPIYEYKFENGKTVYSINNVRYSPSGKAYNGVPYISPITGQGVYYYPPSPFDSSDPFVAGYPLTFDPTDPKSIEKANEVDFTKWSVGKYGNYMTSSNISGDICAVKSWVNSHNIAWDGVNNYNGPCAYF